MKQYAIVKDTHRNEPFGYVVKSGNQYVAYGVHAAGNEWADSYNSGYTKTLEEDLPVGVEIGRFGKVTTSSEVIMKSLKSGNMPFPPEPARSTYVDGESYIGDADTIYDARSRAVASVPVAFKQALVEYKAAAFIQDSRYANVMAKARMTRAALTRTNTGLQSKSLSEAGFERVANSSGTMRRAAIDLAYFKQEHLDQMGYWDATDFEQKKLGQTLRRGVRAAEPYDPNAIDGDEDGIVQDGTPFERPATPRARQLGRLANQARRRDTAAPAPSKGKKRNAGFASDRSRPREKWINKDDIAGDMTLDELGYLEGALKMVMKDVKDPDTREVLQELADAMEMGGAANDMLVMNRDRFNAAKNAVDEWITDNLPGGDATDLLDVMDRMQEADKKGRIWESLDLNERGTRLSTPGFASTVANRNADTKQTIDGNNNFDSLRKSTAGSTRELLTILEDNGFVWEKSGDGYKIYPPDRIRNWILANTNRSEGGYRGSDHVLIHLSKNGKEDSSLKKFISQNLGGDAWKDLKANAKKKGDLQGSGPVGPVPSVMKGDGTRGFGSAVRMRQAAATRAAAPRGFAARTGKKKGKGRIPGVDQVDPRDGSAWAKLTPDQQDALKDALQQVEKDLMKTIATKFPPFMRGFFKDFRNMPFDKATTKPEDMLFKDTEELLQFARYLEERIFDKDDLDAAQKLTIQRYLDNASALMRMRLNDDYSKVEHLHEAARKKAFARAKDGDPNFPTLAKVGGGGESTFFGRAGGLDKDTFEAVVAGTEDAKLGKFRQRLDRAQRRLVTDILRPNPQRQARRAARKARRRGGANVGGFRTEEEKLSITERARRQAGRVRRRVRRLVSGRKSEGRVMKAMEQKEKNKAIRDVDGKIVVDASAPARMKKALLAMRNDPDALKELEIKGNNGQGDIGHNRVMAVLWQAQGMNGLPELLTDDELTDLIEAGHLVILRGHGSSPKYASDYLNDPLRYLPGAGGEAAGKGEYWSDAVTGAGWSTDSSWGNTPGKTQTVGVLPKNTRIIKQGDLRPEADSAAYFSHAWNMATAGMPGGWDKQPLDEVVASLRKEFDKIPAEQRTSRVAQTIEQLLDMADKGDADAISGIELIREAANTDRNLLAPLIGYDAIRIGGDDGADGRILVMSRPSVAALGRAIEPDELKKWAKFARGVRKGEATDAPGKPAKAPKATKFSKATNSPSWKQISGMKRVQGPLGSQGGQWYEDANGQRYLAKPGKSAAHAANEAAVASIMKEYGIGSTTAAIVDDAGTPQILVTGLDIQPVRMTPELQKEAKKHMGIDMLLSNWDAFGAGGQNVGLDKSGKIIRLDAGGGGKFRAQGGDKPSFAPGQPWGDPASMITSSFGQQFYGTVTNGDMAAAMRQVAGVDIAKMDAAMKAAGVDDATRKLFRDTIADRKREAVRLEALFAAAKADSPVKTTGNGPGSTVNPG